ncbi:hypothetical protein [Nonomuraea sediminis]|uniref:hypothetical protein n=1 Tax=Nonomuraea sediminis TaxID=2835864 RepID=UPI001BDC9096|nr:hypothetical protein [Nonomuraea sediminis]
MAGTYHLKIDQGATLDRLITWKNAAGVPYDITGWTAKMQIRDRAGGTLYATLDSANGSIALGGAAGTIRLLATAATTSSWTWTLGRYDLELTDGSSQVTRLLEGLARLSPEVTQ